MIYLVLFTIIAGLFLIYFWDQKRPSRYPPGPWGLPLLGHMHLLGEQPQGKLMEWKNKFGPLFACDLGSFRGVVISDYKMIKEAFNNTLLNGRPKLRPIIERSNGVIKGIIFTQGQEWVEQRRFALRHLRDFGFGKAGTQESLIQEEVDELVQRLKDDAIVGDPISTRTRFNAAIINALWTMISGKRHSHTDPQLVEILRLMTETMSDPSPAALFMPWLTKLLPDLSGWNYFMSDVKPTIDFLQSFIEEHKKSYDQDTPPRDFIDAYLEENRKTSDPESSFYKGYGESSLTFVILDLFFASSETTSHTLTWAMLYLSLNRHVQAKAQEEIDSIVGHGKSPSLSDRTKLPYVEATVMEIMRFSSLIPLGVWHSTIEDVYFNGYHIPKDTMILPNLYAIHHDKDIWGDPEVFRPERFLSIDENDENSIKVIKPEEFIPFSIGKRICIGKNLAEDEIFLFLSAILQTFIIEVDPSNPNPSIEPVFGPVSAPKPFKVIFKLRKRCTEPTLFFTLIKVN